MIKIPRTEKVSLKIQSISASSFKFKARGRKCFATIHYRFAVINRDDNAPESTGPATDSRQTSLLSVSSGLCLSWCRKGNFWNLHCRVFASVQLLGKGDPATLQSQHLEGQAVTSHDSESEPELLSRLISICSEGK